MKYNRQFARRCWRKTFGAGSFKRRTKRRTNWQGAITTQSSWSVYAHGAFVKT